jgi:hypothetical protein
MPSRILILLPVAGLAVALVGVPASQGADPFVAGQLSSRPIAIDASASNRALSRAHDLARTLGFGGVRDTVTRLDDRFDHRVYDEIASFDAHDRQVGLTRLDTDGRLFLALQLGWSPGPGRPISAAAATDKAAAIARAAGLTTDGKPEILRSSGAGGWIVRWPRVVDGVDVRGDGTRVTVWPDGSFHAVARNERPLAARPATTLSADAARSAVERIVATRFKSSAADLAVVAVDQVWIAPNDTWDPARPDAPDALLRLAWVVRLQSRGSLADRMCMLEFWLDAGDGALIGGDIVE